MRLKSSIKRLTGLKIVDACHPFSDKEAEMFVYGRHRRFNSSGSLPIVFYL